MPPANSLEINGTTAQWDEDGNYTLMGTGPIGAKVAVTFGGGHKETVAVSPAGTFQVVVSAHKIKHKVTAEVVGDPGTALDTMMVFAPPQAPVTINAGPLTRDANGNITVTGNAPAGSTVTVTVEGGGTQTVTVSNQGTYSAVVASPTGDRVKVTATVNPSNTTSEFIKVN